MNMLKDLQALTTRIESTDSAGETSRGTGFWFGHPLKFGNCYMIVTNKHVVEDCIAIRIFITLDKDDAKGQSGIVTSYDHADIARYIVRHPDPDVDLAVILASPMLSHIQSLGHTPYIKALSPGLIPNEEFANSLLPIEQITMIGYPIGIMDEKNNLPIVRRGITATPYSSNYNGKQEFVIDAACFPGSSGSPVCLVDNGYFVNNNGELMAGSRFALLGILWGGPNYNAQGKIVARPVPTNLVPIPQTSIPTNLGYVIKATRIIEVFEEACKLKGMEKGATPAFAEIPHQLPSQQ